MTEMDRVQIVENMFPDWKEHLNDGKVIDQVLDGLTAHQVVLNKCSRPGCNNVARRRRKRCIECAAKSTQYMRSMRTGRREAMDAKKLTVPDTDADRKTCSGLTAHEVM